MVAGLQFTLPEQENLHRDTISISLSDIPSITDTDMGENGENRALSGSGLGPPRRIPPQPRQPRQPRQAPISAWSTPPLTPGSAPNLIKVVSIEPKDTGDSSTCSGVGSVNGYGWNDLITTTPAGSPRR